MKQLLASISAPFTRDRPSAIPDLGAASDSDLLRHVGQRIRLHGRLFLDGQQGPFVLLRDRPIYLNHHRDASAAWLWRSIAARLDGRRVEVLGSLCFLASAGDRLTHVPTGLPHSHFYFGPGARVLDRRLGCMH